MNTDISLIQRACAENDPEVFSEIVGRYQGFVYSICYRILGNEADAQDAAQECFVRLAAKANTIKMSLGGWLHRCATQLSIDAARSRSARLVREQIHAQMRNDGTGEITWEDVGPSIDKAMDALPDDLRHVLVEHFLRRRKETDIAAELGISVATISRYVHEGVETIRTSLRKNGIMATSPALAGLISAHAVYTAPAALTATLGKIAIMGVIEGKISGAGAKIAGIKGILATGGMTMKITAGVLITAAVIGGSTVIVHKVAAKGNDKAPLGSESFYPSPERPVGWRGDWTGRFPGATPPLTWSRRVKGVTSEIRYQAAKPSGKPGKDSHELEYFTIKDWLVAGPFDAADPAKAMETDFLGGEATIQPNTGDKAGAVTWKAVHVGMDNQSCHECNAFMNADLNLDFVFLFGKVKEAEGKATIEGDFNNKLAYAHTYVHAPNGGQVRLESFNWGTGSKVWLNGKLLALAADPYTNKRSLTVTLEAGWNRVLVKVAGGPDSFKFMGQNTAGVSQWRSATYLTPVQPLTYEAKNITWMTRMTGRSMSQPIVVGDRIFIGSGMSDLMCIGKADGKVRWIRANTPWEAMAKDDQDKVRAQVEPLIAQLEKLNAETVGAINALAPVPGLSAAQDADMEKRLRDKRELEKKIHDQIATIDRKKFFPGYINEVSSSNGTPVSDGKRVYWACGGGNASAASSVVAAWDFDGKRVWSWHLAWPVPEHGVHTTLLLTDGKVIYGVGNQLIALDPDTGNVVWRITTLNDHTKFFSGGSPVAMKIGREPGVVSHFGAVFKASDGSPVESTLINTGLGDSTPIVEQGVFYSPNNFSGSWTLNAMNFTAIQMPMSVGVKSQLAWEVPATEARVPLMSMAYHISSPLFADGLVYKLDMTGGLVVVDTAQKKKLYSRWLDGYVRYHRYLYGFVASPALAGKRIYFIDNAGYTTVIEPGPAWKPLATNVLENINAFNDYGNRGNQELFYTAPWFEGKAMYLRGEEYLYAIEQQSGTAAR